MDHPIRRKPEAPIWGYLGFDTFRMGRMAPTARPGVPPCIRQMVALLRPFALERHRIERAGSQPERQGLWSVLNRPARPLPGSRDLLCHSPLELLQRPPPGCHPSTETG